MRLSSFIIFALLVSAELPVFAQSPFFQPPALFPQTPVFSQMPVFTQRRVEKIMKFGDTPFPDPKITMTAEACTSVDLADGMGPVHDQTAGTCYAYTALDMMNFGTQERFSPLHLASMKTFTPSKPAAPLCPGDKPSVPGTLDWVGGFNGGYIAEAVKLGINQGLCPASRFPATEGVLNKDYNKLVNYYQNLVKAMGATPEQCYTPDGRPTFPETVQEKLSSGAFHWKTSHVKNELKRMFPTITPERAEKIASTAKSSDELIKNLGAEACASVLKKDVPPGRSETNVQDINNLFTRDCKNYYTEEGRNEMLALINKSLDQKKPAGISYITGGLIQTSAPASHGFHASVISGRSWANGECRYLIKNSWGHDWKVKNGLKARTSKDHPGYFMVTEKQLMEHVYGATAID